MRYRYDFAPFLGERMAKLTVNDLDLQGKRVFTRVDYNVPMAEQAGAMVINDDTRIRATLPTLKAMIDKGARIILTAPRPTQGRTRPLHEPAPRGRQTRRSYWPTGCIL